MNMIRFVAILPILFILFEFLRFFSFNGDRRQLNNFPLLAAVFNFFQ